MTIDVVIPVYRNLKCLAVAARGLLHHLEDPKSLARILIHIQDPAEEIDAVSIIKGLNLPCEVVSRGGETGMADILNRLVSAATADWIVCMEQDTFIECFDLDVAVHRLEREGYIAGGPLDTFLYDNDNARGKPLYGQYGRLSPEPGYFHSSLLFIKREAIAGMTAPFTIPDGFKMHGYGCLGGETYYGLRINLTLERGQLLPNILDRSRLAFFRQEHSDYGYGADIMWNGWHLATHLFYSSTRGGYKTDGFLKPEEHDWLNSEEERFLADYVHRLGIKRLPQYEA